MHVGAELPTRGCALGCTDSECLSSEDTRRPPGALLFGPATNSELERRLADQLDCHWPREGPSPHSRYSGRNAYRLSAARRYRGRDPVVEDAGSGRDDPLYRDLSLAVVDEHGFRDMDTVGSDNAEVDLDRFEPYK